jgi:hypothetical protein
MDVDTVEPGVDFAAAIAREVASCDILIALIGPTWSTIVDRRGRRRLDDPDDFVVLEIRAALERDIRVIPVLVDGAVMPDRDDLPKDLQGLARRNAVRLDHETFRSDVTSLLNAVEEATFGIVARSAIHVDVDDVAREQTPFKQLSAVLIPEISRGRKPARHQVSLTNSGNTPVNTQLIFRDQNGGLTFDPPRGAATVRPGDTLEFSVRINGSHRWFGRTERLPFSAVVAPVGPQPPITLNGTRQQTAHFPWWIPSAAFVIVAITIWLAALFSPTAARVPVVGQINETTAAKRLSEAQYVPDVIKVEDYNIAAGLAIGTDPAGGTALPQGEHVKLYISAGKCQGPCPVEVPIVEGLSVNEAQAKLQDAKFTVRLILAPSDLPVDQVIASDPKATTLRPPGSEVALTVSTGPPSPP